MTTELQRELNLEEKCEAHYSYLSSSYHIELNYPENGFGDINDSQRL
jgi:hypothetical protein